MTEKKVIFDLEIFLEGKSYKHIYNLEVPDEGALFHLLFIKHLLEKVIKEITDIDIAEKEKDWQND